MQWILDNYEWLLALIAILLVGKMSLISTPRIEVEEAKKLLAEGAILVDVRTYEEYRDGHIPGAINIPVGDIGKRAKDDLPNKEKTIVLYCRSGRRSGEAYRLLEQMGYTDLHNLGGINRWPGELVQR